jgi:formate hydrogenlyase subunit 6/NADH:ubiquinone oxidoreductase subunit I
MKIGTMLKDVVGSLFAKSATQLYPAERIEPPKRYRGALDYDPKVCTGCRLCVKDCPSNAIELVIIDRAKKRYVLKYDMDRCVYCGQCVVNCKVKCMGMTHEDWEHAKLKKDFSVYYGSEEDVAHYLAGKSSVAAGAVGSPVK